MKEYLEFAQELAYKAGSIMKEYFYKEKQTEYKSDKTPVTIADKMINDYVIEQVKKKYPTHSVDGEEAKNINKSKYVWVCDPIDGTSMFTRGVPVSVFSLALVYEGVPIVGVVYDPFLNDMYTAIKDSGAYCNDKPIKVSDKEYGELGCSIDYCMWNNAKFDTLEIAKDIRKDVKLCQVGSTAHASMLVAKGTICAEIFPGTSHGHCDMAASKLIVTEAGGKVTDFYGNDQRYDQAINGAILTNNKVHDKLLSKIKKHL